MTRLAMFVWMLATIAAPVAAQGIHVGVKGGVNLATQQVSGDAGDVAMQWRAGFLGGGFVRLPLFSSIGLQVEGLYSVKGAKLSFERNDAIFDLTYVEVPILARLQLGSGRRHYFVVGGPAPAFRVRARVQTPFLGSTETTDVSDQVESIDLGIAAGGGIEIGSLVIDARYTLGLRDIDKDHTDASRTKNRAVAITAGVRF